MQQQVCKRKSRKFPRKKGQKRQRDELQKRRNLEDYSTRSDIQQIAEFQKKRQEKMQRENY